MPSTYTLNNGIELIGTGEQSGTWGDTTNTNFNLIDTALDGQVTVTLASAGTSGSPNALPISDGTASNGRNRMIIFGDGGDLGATAYVQLTPNDAEKIVYVRNDLSGSRSIILFQGTYSASNDYEVPAGTTAVVYFDGGGSGAVAANVFNNAYFDSLRLGSVSVTAILDEDNMASDSATALATQQSIKAYVDSQVTAQDLDFDADTGTGAVDLDSQTFSIIGTFNQIDTTASGQTLTISLPSTIATTTADLTNLEVTNIKAKDGTASVSIADVTGVMTISSAVLTTADINGGTIDGSVIGGGTAAAGSFTTLSASTNLTINATTTINGIIDDDTMATASATTLATSESIKQYVDDNVTAQDLDFAGDTGTGAVDLDSQTFTVAGTTNEIETSASGQTITIGLPNAVTISSLTATTADINGGTIDGTTIGGTSAAAGTFTTATATTGNITTVNATTVDTTNLEVTNLKAKDGTAAGSIADSTGVVTLSSSVLTTTDINGGTIDGTIIGGSTPAAGTFTTATATTGNITTVNATTVDTTNIEVTNIKAKDGTSAGSIADVTGVVTLASSVLTTADINAGTIDNTTIGATTAAAGTFTTLNATGGGSLTGTWSDLGSVTTVDINGGTIDGTVIGGASAAAATVTTLTVNTSATMELDQITSTSDLPVSLGGTGASTAAAARTNLDVDQAGTALALAIALG